MPAIPRRSFVERLGLGAGAVLLAPIAVSLVGEARGQTVRRKRFLAFVTGSGIHFQWVFPPPELAGAQVDQPVAGTTSFSWPAFIKPLERYRARIALVDGLGNTPKRPGGEFTHSIAFGALSCMPPPGGASLEFGPPGGITIDQQIAAGIGAGTYHRSVLFGLSLLNASNGRRPVLATVFASGANRPEVHFENPASLFRHLFGDLAADAGGLRRLALRKRLLLDTMRFDVKRLQGALAGSERRKLDEYLGAIGEVEGRLQVSLGLSCPGAATPSAVGPTYEDRLEAMNEMATLALVCGLTNVVGVCAGAGNSHSTFPSSWTRLGATIDLHGNAETFGKPMVPVHQFLSGLVARTLDALSAIKEGDGTLGDSLVALYTSDNGEQHHSNKIRWPAVVIGDAGPGRRLATGGRFFRFPPRKGMSGRRALADLYSTLATACGVPADAFGKGGNEEVRGPIDELLS